MCTFKCISCLDITGGGEIILDKNKKESGERTHHHIILSRTGEDTLGDLMDIWGLNVEKTIEKALALTLGIEGLQAGSAWIKWARLPKEIQEVIKITREHKVGGVTLDYYTDYFENPTGKSWVFYSDSTAVILTGSDIDWDAVPVKGTRIPRPLGLILSKQETELLNEFWPNLLPA